MIPLGQFLHSFLRAGALDLAPKDQDSSKYCRFTVIRALFPFKGIQWVFQTERFYTYIHKQ